MYTIGSHSLFGPIFSFYYKGKGWAEFNCNSIKGTKSNY